MSFYECTVVPILPTIPLSESVLHPVVYAMGPGGGKFTTPDHCPALAYRAELKEWLMANGVTLSLH
jgi:hypothetical protein